MVSPIRRASRAETRRVVDQHVQAAEFAENLQRDWIDVVFLRHVADDAVGVRQLGGDPLHGVRRAGDEGDVSAARDQFADQREAKS